MADKKEDKKAKEPTLVDVLQSIASLTTALNVLTGQVAELTTKECPPCDLSSVESSLSVIENLCLQIREK